MSKNRNLNLTPNLFTLNIDYIVNCNGINFLFLCST